MSQSLSGHSALGYRPPDPETTSRWTRGRSCTNNHTGPVRSGHPNPPATSKRSAGPGCPSRPDHDLGKRVRVALVPIGLRREGSGVFGRPMPLACFDYLRRCVGPNGHIGVDPAVQGIAHRVRARASVLAVSPYQLLHGIRRVIGVSRNRPKCIELILAKDPT